MFSITITRVASPLPAGTRRHPKTHNCRPTRSRQHQRSQNLAWRRTYEKPLSTYKPTSPDRRVSRHRQESELASTDPNQTTTQQHRTVGHDSKSTHSLILPLILLHLPLPLRLRTPTPRPPTLRRTASPGPTRLPLRRVCRRRPHKRKVDGNGLIEEFGVVGAADGRYGFLLRRVLEESVTLRRVKVTSINRPHFVS